MWSRPDVRTGTAGNARPSSSAVRRAPTIWARSRLAPQATQCQAVSARPHQAQLQIPLVRCLQRSRAVPAPGGLAAALAGQPGRVATTRHLHQHRSAAQPVPHGLPGEAGQPRRPGRPVPGQLAVADGTDQRRRDPQLFPVRAQRQRPAALHQLGGLHRAVRAAEQERAPAVRGPQLQDLPDMRERGVVVAVAGVAVVPDGDQAQIRDRREHGGPRPDHRAHGSAPHGEPLPVPLLGPGVGGQQRVAARPEQLGERGVHPPGTAPVRYDDERTPPGGEGRGDGPGDLLRPVRARQRGPYGPGRPALGQRPQERGPLLVPLPAPGRRRRRRRQRFRRRLGLGPSVPGRHGELQHIGETARVPVGDGPGQGEQLGSEHRLGRDDIGERGERPRGSPTRHAVR